MNIKVLENKKEKLLLEFEDETETVTNLVATQVWQEGGEAAAIREHPFIENPELVIMGRNPKRLLTKASSALEAQCDEFKEKFRRTLEK
ncbi:MAG: DNA-directed RNA polymerase subunit L [Candidatus Aenigmarchaeota archaeon]|nr:DNA-directed RNA polymerase subunit L [Candidatus Aenigmarchaeota archaeon]